MKYKEWLHDWLELYQKESVKPRTYKQYEDIISHRRQRRRKTNRAPPDAPGNLLCQISFSAQHNRMRQRKPQQKARRYRLYNR